MSNNMNELFIKRLIYLCKEKEIKPQQLRYHINVQSATITKWTKGELLPNSSILIQLSQYFHCSIDYLLGLTDVKDIISSNELRKNIPIEDKQILDKYHNLSQNNKSIVDYIMEMEEESEPIEETKYSDKVIKLLDKGDVVLIDTYYMPVSAGYGNILIEDVPIRIPYQTTKISSKSDFCVRVSGNSMEKYCYENDFLFVQKTNEELQNKELGIFIYNGESMFKEYRNLNGYKALVSHNTNYKDKVIDKNSTCETIGRVLGKYHID